MCLLFNLSFYNISHKTSLTADFGHLDNIVVYIVCLKDIYMQPFLYDCE